MTIPKHSHLWVLLPSSFENNTKWEELFLNQNEECAEVKFGSKTFVMLKAFITNTLHHDEVANGIECSKLKHGFNNGNFGSIVEFETSKIPHVIAWNEILTTHDNGMQVWSDQINSRDAHPMFLTNVTLSMH